MIRFRTTAEVKDDRQVVLTLPPEVPTGKADLVVIIDSPSPKKKPRSSLADWADANSEHHGGELNSEAVEGFTGRRL